MARTYTPRRAGKARWLKAAPEWVLDVLDDNTTHDRYTILLAGSQLVSDGTYSGTHIQFVASSEYGATYWGELRAHEAAAYRYRCSQRRQRIRWLDLPEIVRKAVTARVTAPD